jgi:translin
MLEIDQIAEQAHLSFEARTQARDRALANARQLTRHSANAIRAIHRGENDLAAEHLTQGRQLFTALYEELAPFPDLYFSGYTQDAIKEYCEATITVSLIQNRSLPTPEEMNVEYATYLRGLSETPGELRRRVLDILRHGYTPDVERLLGAMDDIYGVLITMDYPDAITNGLRRQTDLVRGIVERTRADLTISLREEQLKSALEKALERLPDKAE